MQQSDYSNPCRGEPGSIPAGNTKIFACEKRGGRFRWSTDFLEVLPFPPHTASSALHTWVSARRGRRGGLVVRLLASHLGGPVSIPGGGVPGFALVGIVRDDVAGRRVFSGISPPPLHSVTASFLWAVPDKLWKAEERLSRTQSGRSKVIFVRDRKREAVRKRGKRETRRELGATTVPRGLQCNVAAWIACYEINFLSAKAWRSRADDVGSKLSRDSGLSYQQKFFNYSPRVVSENHGKPKSGWPRRESNPRPPECEFIVLALRLLAWGVGQIRREVEEYTKCIRVDIKQGFQKCSLNREQPIYTNGSVKRGQIDSTRQFAWQEVEKVGGHSSQQYTAASTQQRVYSASRAGKRDSPTTKFGCKSLGWETDERMTDGRTRWAVVNPALEPYVVSAVGGQRGHGLFAWKVVGEGSVGK
ncbi:hypothetical protein PR048_008064 [Dryococelus australis]|uniref:Uncharacterized protein n=1 Tax=Dryococelus australis TaxID=614101 RepID=A0ABQ9HW08_9NEOP|nr:hypothetical protein PR048_008064 [Dryococelus australis]